MEQPEHLIHNPRLNHENVHIKNILIQFKSNVCQDKDLHLNKICWYQ